MTPDAIISVRFNTSEENGRSTAVGSSHTDFYACPFFIDGEAFDCRIFLPGKVLELGMYYEVPVKFMNSDLVLSKLAVGKKFSLWEGKFVAVGTVLSINAKLI